MLSFGEKTAKIGSADPGIIVLREIIKTEKKLTHAKYPSGKFAEWAKHKLVSWCLTSLFSTNIWLYQGCISQAWFYIATHFLA